MGVAAAYPVRSPRWVLTYAGKNITTDVSRMVVSIIYADALAGQAGELELEIEDRDRRWQGPWYPALGDKLNLMIGYGGEPLLPCGDFEIDQLELDGPPDLFRLRCLAAWVTPAMRTQRSAAYENQSLLQIASTVGARYGLGVSGAPDALNLVFARVTQKQETDLAFLKRLANEHNYDFTVRGGQLVFYARQALEAQPPVMAIKRTTVERFSFENRTRRIYKAAQAAYHNPVTKQLITQTVQVSGIPTGDTLKLTRRCENGQQALLKAQAALHLNNMRFTRARMTMPGITRLAAGNTIALDGWGAFDAVYIIETACHRLNRARGYSTDIEVRRVGV